MPASPSPTRRAFLADMGVLAVSGRILRPSPWLRGPSAAFTTALREKHRVVVKRVPKTWLNGIRVSTHIFNSQRDIDQLIRALRRELA